MANGMSLLAQGLNKVVKARCSVPWVFLLCRASGPFKNQPAKCCGVGVQRGHGGSLLNVNTKRLYRTSTYKKVCSKV
jgi:hypothetical protein